MSKNLCNGLIVLAIMTYWSLSSYVFYNAGYNKAVKDGQVEQEIVYTAEDNPELFGESVLVEEEAFPRHVVPSE